MTYLARSNQPPNLSRQTSDVLGSANTTYVGEHFEGIYHILLAHAIKIENSATETNIRFSGELALSGATTVLALFAALTNPAFTVFALGAGGIGAMTLASKVARLGVGQVTIALGDGKKVPFSNYNLLPPRDKSTLTLIRELGKEVAVYLSQFNDLKIIKTEWDKMSHRFHKEYGAAVFKNPDDLWKVFDRDEVKRLVFAPADQYRLLKSQPQEQVVDPIYAKTVDVDPIKTAQPTTIDTLAVPAPPTYAYRVDNVDADDVLEDPWGVTPSPASTPVSTAITPEFETALDCILNSPFKSRAFFGAQRSGKSMMVSIISRKLHNRGVKVFHLNLLSFVKEDLDEDAEYTKHCVESIRADISHIPTNEDGQAEVNELVQDCVDMIQRWWDCPGEAILIVDEWAYLSSKDCYFASFLESIVKLISDKRAATGSSGMKREKAVYMIAPTMVASNMTKSGLSIKSSDLVYVTINPNSNVDWNGQGVTFDHQLFDQVKNNFTHLSYPEGLDAERIAYVGDRWYPLGTHPDMLNEEIKPHSGTYVNLAPAKYKPESTAPEPAIQTSSVAVMERPEPEDDLMDLFDFVEPEEVVEIESYDDYDNLILKLNQSMTSDNPSVVASSKFFLGMLTLLGELGQGFDFTVDSEFTKNKVFQSAKASGALKSQSKESVVAALMNLTKDPRDFVEHLGENTFKVTLH